MTVTSTLACGLRISAIAFVLVAVASAAVFVYTVTTKRRKTTRLYNKAIVSGAMISPSAASEKQVDIISADKLKWDKSSILMHPKEDSHTPASPATSAQTLTPPSTSKRYGLVDDDGDVDENDHEMFYQSCFKHVSFNLPQHGQSRTPDRTPPHTFTSDDRRRKLRILDSIDEEHSESQAGATTQGSQSGDKTLSLSPLTVYAQTPQQHQPQQEPSSVQSGSNRKRSPFPALRLICCCLTHNLESI
jgi:hypothetical protein